MNSWIPVGDLANGFATKSYALPQTGDLSGKTFMLNYDSGGSVHYRFDKEHIHSSSKDVNVHYHGQVTPYRATYLRSHMYFVDFINQKEEEGGKKKFWSVSLVLDLGRQYFTAVVGQMPSQAETEEPMYRRGLTGKELTGVKADFHNGTIDRPYEKDETAHVETDELIGLRNRYSYSPTEIYEHIYLNQGFYTWQSLAGAEKGLCDTDRCHYFKISDELYLFVWREKIVPTLGVVMIDLKAHRSDGKIFGYKETSFDEISNFRMASFCKILNKTDYQNAVRD